MKKPILFNTEMVKAILSGNKTQTRRVVKKKYENTDIEFFTNKYGTRLVEMQNDVPAPIINADGSKSIHLKACETIKQPYQVGDILWVRETFWEGDLIDENDNIVESGVKLYKADEPNIPSWGTEEYKYYKWRPSIHMPKAAARIFLRVTDVRAERLNNITEKDARAEGATKLLWYQPYGTKNESNQSYIGNLVNHHANYKTGFAHIWDRTLNKKSGWKYSFKNNPWVWVIEFEKLD